ncbi:hypothetical protein BU24DRAFT_190007 [Aaosphaeria arxii CBS 175.79]|uniref:Uncharacterized protein n=1 Tax=Aaosphaeria arxii CBS 175.79 TaxID=1450172 RepID=A0A6A5XT64_9PLEO|nr:uncharacterized protein BU24DRAFT_190007 [Aaosphaeria arxii CBS 175.79]KAF2016007.1 hypothetical protein BU24DRAFT_190007 [Aaosphaeria arxii CBS 175.79]
MPALPSFRLTTINLLCCFNLSPSLCKRPRDPILPLASHSPPNLTQPHPTMAYAGRPAPFADWMEKHREGLSTRFRWLPLCSPCVTGRNMPVLHCAVSAAAGPSSYHNIDPSVSAKYPGSLSVFPSPSSSTKRLGSALQPAGSFLRFLTVLPLLQCIS